MAKDAVEAAPGSHKKIFENEHVRVLEIEIKPGEKEAPHTHEYKGVVIVTSPSKLRFYNDKDEVEFETEATRAEWREPSGEHAVENIGSDIFKAFRVEIKQ